MTILSRLARALKPREQRFWLWFEENEDALFNWERDPQRTFSRLAAAMRSVHPNIVFEFGPVKGNSREFVISADGIKDAFPMVESLYATAPRMSRWVFVKFRPRREAMEIRIEDLALGPDDVEVAVREDGDKLGLRVHIRGYRENGEEKYLKAAFIMLDQAVGEYNMEMWVGQIDFLSFEQSSATHRLRLVDLPEVFDRFLARLSDSAGVDGR